MSESKPKPPQISDEVVPPKDKLQRNTAGEVFGAEGTNKTLPEPQTPTPETHPGVKGKDVPSSPYKRQV